MDWTGYQCNASIAVNNILQKNWILGITRALGYMTLVRAQ